MTGGPGGPVRLLFLIGDTGGGHRSAASAVRQALHRHYPGHFDPVLCDPLRGPGTPLRLRALISLYGPCIRLTPWLWGLLWRGCDSPRMLAWSQRTLLAAANGSVARAVAAHRPAVIACFHPFTADPAVRARDLGAPGVPVVTVITDLVTTHRAWRDAAVDRVVVPSAPVARRCAEDGIPAGRYVEVGLPVGAGFAAAPAAEPDRRALQRALGLRGQRFLVVMTGGAEGSGGLYRRARAILRHLPEVDVAVICGRNRRLRRRLDRLAAAHGRQARGAWLRGQHGRLAALRRRGRRQGRAGHHRRSHLLRRPAGADLVRPGPGGRQRRLRDQRRGRPVRARAR